MSGLHFEGGGFTPFVLTLERFQHHLGDASTAFGAMADYQKKVVNARQFEGQGSPEVGGAWSPLSPRYAAWKAKKRPGAPILVFDGKLKNEMTSPGAGVYEVWSSGFTVGSDLFYAKYHQEGTKHMPARPLQGERRKSDVRNLTKILQRWIVEGQVAA